MCYDAFRILLTPLGPRRVVVLLLKLPPGPKLPNCVLLLNKPAPPVQ